MTFDTFFKLFFTVIATFIAIVAVKMFLFDRHFRSEWPPGREPLGGHGPLGQTSEGTSSPSEATWGISGISAGDVSARDVTSAGSMTAESMSAESSDCGTDGDFGDTSGDTGGDCGGGDSGGGGWSD